MDIIVKYYYTVWRGEGEEGTGEGTNIGAAVRAVEVILINHRTDSAIR